MLPASIPSPPDNGVGIGDLQLRAYGLAIAAGVLVALAIARRRWQARGGDPDAVSAAATWGVPAGLLGARAYHVLTDHEKFAGRWLDAFKVWEGGLGIPGGLLVGVAVGVWVADRKGMRPADALDVVAPAIPVAQAIGRLGNWFNQELYGKATSLPWALEIDPEHRPAGMIEQPTYHPTFLYEALWNLALAAVLVRLDRTRRLARGALFCLYVAGYGLGRLWVEGLRIDPASQILGLRVNTWVSMLAIAGGLAAFLWRQRSAGRTPAPADG